MVFQHTIRVLLFLAALANAHSWIEQLTVIAPNGTFVGAPGYARGNVQRTAPGFSDTEMDYLIPPLDRANVNLILPTDKMCRASQQHQNQADGSPRLQASPGAAVALRYQENGHVTLPWNQPGKPKNRGTVYVYGTTQPKADEKFLDVHGSWNWDGTGGDKRGVLLSKQNFDDGRCYQINNGNISMYRQKSYPHKPDQLMGADLWCQQDIQLPRSAPSGKPYTLYWVWDWPTAPGADPTYPHGKKEIYTTCMDIDVVDTPKSRLQIKYDYAEGQDLNRAAIPSEFADLSKAKSPRPTSVNTKTSTSTVTLGTMTSTEGALRTLRKAKAAGRCQATGTAG